MAKHKADDFDYIRMTTADINGLGRCKIIPGHGVSKYLERNAGITISRSVITGGPHNESVINEEIRRMKYDNFRLAPQLETLHPLTWVGEKGFLPNRQHGQLICEVQYIDGRPLEADPRYTTRRLLDKLYKKHELRLFSTYEMEFFLFHSKKLQSPHPYQGKHMFSTDFVNAMEPYLNDLVKALSAANVKIEMYNVERANGQWEFNLVPQFGIVPADGAFIFKEAAHGCGENHDVRATFMTKPYPIENASGTHFNHSLWTKNNTNALFDPHSENNLSSIARHWIAGLLAHAKGIQALSSPSVNCYRRFHGRLVPGDITWIMENRKAAIRVHSYNAAETYIENRLPSSAANPYLIMAATIAAGMDGLDRQLELPPEKESQGSLAKTLEEALSALENDKIITAALGTQIVEWFIDSKRLGELQTLQGVDILDKTSEGVQREIDEYFHI